MPLDSVRPANEICRIRLDISTCKAARERFTHKMTHRALLARCKLANCPGGFAASGLSSAHAGNFYEAMCSSRYLLNSIADTVLCVLSAFLQASVCSLL